MPGGKSEKDWGCNSRSSTNWIGGVVNKLAQGNVMSWANVLLGFQPVAISINIRIVYR